MSRILFITHSLVNDFSSGGAQRANHLRNALLAAHSVDTLTIRDGAVFSVDPRWSDDRVRVGIVDVQGLSPRSFFQRWAMQRRIASLLKELKYDYIVAQYRNLAAMVPAAARSRMIFDADDFIKTAPPGDQLSRATRYKIALRNMLAQRVASQALHVWYVSRKAGHLPRSRHRSWMPNVTAEPNAGPKHDDGESARLLMVGQFGYDPNILGLTWFVQYVWPSLAARFPELEIRAVGANGEALAGRLPDVDFAGFVDEIAIEYAQATIVIAPIRSGGGTQIKVIDALAHGRPLVASKFAQGGFADELKDGEHLLVADSPDEWIEACTRLLSHPDDAARMAARGRQQVVSTYGPDRMVNAVRTTFAELSKRRS